MFGLTQILTTSKTCQQTGVNLLLTSAMDTDQQAAVLRKLKYKLDNLDLSTNKRKQLEDKVDAINTQLKAFKAQLTPLRVTKVIKETHL